MVVDAVAACFVDISVVGGKVANGVFVLVKVSCVVSSSSVTAEVANVVFVG